MKTDVPHNQMQKLGVNRVTVSAAKASRRMSNNKSLEHKRLATQNLTNHHCSRSIHLLCDHTVRHICPGCWIWHAAAAAPRWGKRTFSCHSPLLRSLYLYLYCNLFAFTGPLRRQPTWRHISVASIAAAFKLSSSSDHQNFWKPTC